MLASCCTCDGRRSCQVVGPIHSTFSMYETCAVSHRMRASHNYMFDYLPLTMLLLHAPNACISFQLLILLGCRQFCPVFVFLLLCFALASFAPSARWCSTVVSSGLACSICAPPCSTTVFNLCSSVSLLHASGVLLKFPVSVVSVLIRTFGFAFCPVVVYIMILCSCRPL
jgi:hypothetical protein